MFTANIALWPVRRELKTDYLIKLLPTFAAEYNKGRRIDIRFSLYHKLFKKGVPDAKITAINIGKEGSIKL